MAPPSYADLGKSARDLFSRGFHFGQYKVEVKTKTEKGVEFTTGGTTSHETGNFCGNLETKFKWKEHGVTFTEKYTTDNTLTSEISVEDKILEGLKAGFETKFSPATGKKSGKVKSEFKQDNLHLNCDVDIGTVSALTGLVIGYNGFLGGAQFNYDSSKTDKSILQQMNLASGYSKDDLDLFFTVKAGCEYVGSIFHRVRSDLETGVQVSWTQGSNDTTFDFGAKYNLDSATTLRAKVDNATRVGLSFQHKLRPGVTLTLSALILGKNLSAGGHKFGAALEFEA